MTNAARICMIAALLALLACTRSGDESDATSRPRPSRDQETEGPEYGPPKQAGKVQVTGIDEISGVVASERSPVFWVQEDSGNPAAIHAIELNGTLRASVDVRGAINVDWEDIALAGGTIWLADIGDNELQRDRLQVYRFPEPTLDATTVTAEVLQLRYEDGPHDAEALIVDAREGALYVITKELLVAAGVYRAEFAGAPGGKALLLERVGELQLGFVTAADLGPDGIVVKDYVKGLLYPWTDDGDVISALAGAGCAVPVGGGESIAFGHDGNLVAIPEDRAPPVFTSARG